MRFVVASTIVLLTALSVAPPTSAQAPDATATLLSKQYSEWMTAFRRRDGATMDKLEAAGLTLVLEDGTIWAKDKPRVEGLKGLKPVSEAHTVEQVHLRVQGDVAVLTGVHVDNDPKAYGDTNRASFTTVWKRQGPVWKVWSAQWTAQPPAAKK